MVDKISQSISQITSQIEENVKRLKAKTKGYEQATMVEKDDAYSSSLKVGSDYLSLSLNNFAYSKLEAGSLYEVQLNYSQDTKKDFAYAANSYSSTLDLGTKQDVVLGFLHPNNQKFDFKI